MARVALAPLPVLWACGGFNLHWAFGSGITAGRDAVRTLRRPHKKR